MESRASSRVTPVAFPSFRSTFQPLNQGICRDRNAVKGGARQGPGSQHQEQNPEVPASTRDEALFHCNPMDRGAWQATYSSGGRRVRHD